MRDLPQAAEGPAMVLVYYPFLLRLILICRPVIAIDSHLQPLRPPWS